MMKADARPGAPWSEGYAPPPYYWTDRAQVFKVGEKTTVPAGTYTGILVVQEYSEQEPLPSSQLKYYAPGVGVVRVGWLGGDKSKETLQLVTAKQLSSSELATARAGALQLETRASVYGRAAPAEVRK